MSDVVFSDANFNQEVLQSKTPVLVDFWAPWCGPCRMVSPVIEELAKDYEGRVAVGKVNVDENPTTASQFSIMSIPSIVLFKDGKPVKVMVGAQGKDNYKKEIEEVLGSA